MPIEHLPPDFSCFVLQKFIDSNSANTVIETGKELIQNPTAPYDIFLPIDLGWGKGTQELPIKRGLFHMCKTALEQPEPRSWPFDLPLLKRVIHSIFTP